MFVSDVLCAKINAPPFLAEIQFNVPIVINHAHQNFAILTATEQITEKMNL
jgi:hypothetical protein